MSKRTAPSIRLSRLDARVMFLFDRRGERMARVMRVARKIRHVHEGWATGEALFFIHTLLGLLVVSESGLRAPVALLLVVREPAIAFGVFLLVWRFMPHRGARAARLDVCASLSIQYTALCAVSRVFVGGLRPSVFLLGDFRVFPDLWLLPGFLAACSICSALSLWGLRRARQRQKHGRKVVQ